MEKMILLSLDDMLIMIDSLVASMVNEEIDQETAEAIINKILIMGGMELEELKIERDDIRG